MTIVIALLVLLLGALALAWYDGGRETPRMIEQRVDLSEIAQ